MKVAITSTGKDKESMIDQKFGRSDYFLIMDTENKEEIQCVQNQGNIQGHGAGIRAAEQLGELNVKAIITGNLGPNATKVMQGLGIKAYKGSGTVAEVFQKFLDGNLKEIEEIVEAHSGISQKENPEEISKPVQEVQQKKKERIFFPLLDNNRDKSKISEHFGHAPFFGVYDIDEGKLDIIENDLEHADPTKSPIDQIEEAVNPTIIFAKGIGGRAISIIEQKDIVLKTGPYQTVGDAIKNIDDFENLSESCGH